MPILWTNISLLKTLVWSFVYKDKGSWFSTASFGVPVSLKGSSLGEQSQRFAICAHLCYHDSMYVFRLISLHLESKGTNICEIVG